MNIEGVCYRTNVAVRTKTLKHSRWKQYVKGDLKETKQEELSADNFIVSSILRIYYEEAKHTIQGLLSLREQLPLRQRNVLRDRWIQIKKLVIQAFVNGINVDVRSQTYQLFDLSSPNSVI